MTGLSRYRIRPIIGVLYPQPFFPECTLRGCIGRAQFLCSWRHTGRRGGSDGFASSARCRVHALAFALRYDLPESFNAAERELCTYDSFTAEVRT